MTGFDDQADVYVPTLALRVGGRPLEPDVARRVTSVSVTQRLHPPDSFSIQLYDPKLELIEPQAEWFTEGAEVEIQLGYVGRTRKLLTGRVAAVSAEFPESGPPVLRVDGFDLLHDLTRGTVHRVFADSASGNGRPDSQVVAEIAREMGLGAVVDSTPDRGVPRVQNNITNLAFVQKLAAANGFLLWVQDRTLHFQRQRPAPNAMRLTRGRNLRSFTPRLSTSGQVESVEVRGWDPAQQQSFSVSVDLNAKGLARTGRHMLATGAGGRSKLAPPEYPPVSSVQEARALAEQMAADLRRALITGEGSCVGDPDLRVGTRLELRGVGRFSDTYTVTEATHTLGESGYQTTFQVNGDGGTAGPFEDLEPSGGGRLLGVLPGVVTDNNDDERRGRVKVRLPGPAGDTEHWARLATMMAGKDQGSFFLPQVKDEVLVAFEQGEVGSAFVVGALWNGRDQQPDANPKNLRFLKSRSGHLLRMDDTEQAEKLELIDASGDSSVVLDTATGKLTITAAKDLVIQAANGTIHLEGNDLVVNAKNRVSISGNQVQVSPAGPEGG
jgi:phage protein D/phage baseplate assembly protein gpV